jgi:hypothetical protein
MAYGVAGHPGIAFHLLGPETVPDGDTEWTGMEVETGRVIVVMVGDDRRIPVDPEDVTPIADEDYCSGCGQIGCNAYGS